MPPQSPSKAVLDTSALFALMQNEPGSDAVQKMLPGALMSSVNLAEAIGKLCEKGMPSAEALAAIEAVGIEIVPFDSGQARLVGELRLKTRSAGLSLGDRACLALAWHHQLPAMTADRAWTAVKGIDVVLIRDRLPAPP